MDWLKSIASVLDLLFLPLFLLFITLVAAIPAYFLSKRGKHEWWLIFSFSFFYWVISLLFYFLLIKESQGAELFFFYVFLFYGISLLLLVLFFVESKS